MPRRNPPIGPRPAHRIFTESPAFKAWFGPSVLVREDGDPLVLFHGTDKDFSVFEKVGSTSLRPLGFWFADDPDDAEAFGDRLMPVYLRVEAPYYANLRTMQESAFEDKTWAARFRANLIAKGHDGIIIRPKTEQVGRFTLRDPMLVCVFDPRQIKSAIGNIGTFDKSTPDITRNPSGRGGTGRRARLKIEFPYRSASSSLAAPTKHNPPIDLAPYAVEPKEYERKFYSALFRLSPTSGAMRERNKEARFLLARNGYTLGRLLGTGTFASVYALTGMPDRVAKVTNDPTDAAIMAEVMNAPRGVLGLPKVYGVYELPRAYDHRKGWVVVVERLLPLSEKDRRTFNEISDRYDLGWSIATGHMPSRGTQHPMEVAFVQALMYLSSLGYLVGDVGPSNFMRRRDGSYVVSDFGGSAVNERNMPAAVDVPVINPVDLKGRAIPERYLAGLPHFDAELKKKKNPRRNPINTRYEEYASERARSFARRYRSLGLDGLAAALGVYVGMSLGEGNVVYLDQLEAKITQTGAGSKVMNMLTDLADQTGVTLMLTAQPIDGRIPLPRLVAFYEGFGFAENMEEDEDDDTGAGVSMVRFPERENPRDLKGRHVPERYVAGLPAPLRATRLRELTLSRDAYRLGDFSELPTDRLAREMGLVKKSAYSKVAEQRGIEWRGNAKDMAERVCKHYGVSCTKAVADAITKAYSKGLAAWKSGGHRPGATARNWAVARVNSLVVGGKAALTADATLFRSLPFALRKAILAKTPEVVSALRKQGREADARFVAAHSTR